MSIVVGCLVLILLYMVAAASSATLTVNWSLGTDYTPLSTGKTFSVGDTIVFNYGAGHTVDEVSENDYKSCTLGNSISSDSSGTTTIALTTTGPRYFICGIPGHCASGMKVSISVTSASTNVTGVGGGTTMPTPFAGGGGYNTTTTQAIPCAAWALSSPIAALVVAWSGAFYVLALF